MTRLDELKELSTVWHVCFDIGVSHGIDVGFLATDSSHGAGWRVQ